MKKIIGMLLVSGIAALMFAGCSGTPSSSPDASGAQSAGEAAGAFDPASPISVISREDGSGTRGAFIELTGVEVKGSDGTKTDMTTPEANVYNSTEAVLTTVAGDPYAIGYVSLGSLNNSVKALKVDGVEATAENVKNGSYTISRPFNIATKGDIDPVSQDFINFILSKEGQAVVSGSYISISDSAEAFTGTNPEGTIMVAGSSSVSPVMEKLKEAYAAINPKANIQINTSDSTSGMTAVADGTCQIGMASRELKDSEKEKGLTPIQIALDGIALVVNPENTTEDITKDQIKSIYTGETVTWELN